MTFLTLLFGLQGARKLCGDVLSSQLELHEEQSCEQLSLMINLRINILNNSHCISVKIVCQGDGNGMTVRGEKNN